MIAEHCDLDLAARNLESSSPREFPVANIGLLADNRTIGILLRLDRIGDLPLDFVSCGHDGFVKKQLISEYRDIPVHVSLVCKRGEKTSDVVIDEFVASASKVSAFIMTKVFEFKLRGGELPYYDVKLKKVQRQLLDNRYLDEQFDALFLGMPVYFSLCEPLTKRPIKFYLSFK